MYSVQGRTTTAGGSPEEVVAQLWNPHATARIKIVQIMLCVNAAPGAGIAVRMKRVTGRGTAGSTVTPDIDNHLERSIAPASGALLDLGNFSVNATIAASELGPAWVAPVLRGSAWIYSIPGNMLIVTPGTGIAVVIVSNPAWPVTDVTFCWLEDW